MDFSTERLARVGMYLAVTGCSVVATLLLGTGLQQLFLTDVNLTGMQAGASVLGAMLGAWWWRVMGRRWAEEGAPATWPPVWLVKADLRPPASAPVHSSARG